MPTRRNRTPHRPTHGTPRRRSSSHPSSPDGRRVSPITCSARAHQGRSSEGVAQLRQATAGDPRAHYRLGYELFREGRQEEAASEFEAFVRREPLLLEVVNARLMLGRIHTSNRRFASAEHEFAEVLRMVPSHIDAQLNLGDALFAQEKYGEAATHYRAYPTWPTRSWISGRSTNQLPTPNTRSLWPHRRRESRHPGSGPDGAGRIERALTQFREASRLEPRSAEYRAHMVEAERLLGHRQP